jgi:hypothetical protein
VPLQHGGEYGHEAYEGGRYVDEEGYEYEYQVGLYTLNSVA